MNLTVEDRPICPRCPRCGKSSNSLWRCDTRGQWKGKHLCYKCDNELMTDASLDVSAQIVAMPKDLLAEIAKKDVEDLWGK